MSKKEREMEFEELTRVVAYRHAMDSFITTHELRQPSQPGLQVVEEIAIAAAHIVRTAAQRAGLDLRNLSRHEGIALGVVICGTSDGISQLAGERSELSASVAAAELLVDSFGIQAADIFHEAASTFADLAADDPPNEVLIGLGKGAQRLLLKNDDDKFAALAEIIKWMIAQFSAVPDPKPTLNYTRSQAADADTAPTAGLEPGSSKNAGMGRLLFGLGAIVGILVAAAWFTQLGRPTDTRVEPFAARPMSDVTGIPSDSAPPPTPATSTVGMPSREVFSPTESHALIPDGAEAVSTVAGILSIADSTESFGGHHLELNGRPLAVSNDHLHLISITRHGSQDLVLAASQCAGTGCGYLDLAFVRLYPDGTAALETTDAFLFPSDYLDRLKEGVSLRDTTTEVALGLTSGAYWFASIGPSDALTLTSNPAPIQPLTADDCGFASQMLDYCAELETPCQDAPFSEFPRNCPGAAMPLYRATAYLTRHTTGLNLPAFAQACKSASELRITPSPTFIESAICSGADPSQWRSAESTTNFTEDTAELQ